MAVRQNKHQVESFLYEHNTTKYACFWLIAKLLQLNNVV